MNIPTDNTPPDVRKRLIEATISLLALHGPAEVKARSVSKEAGLSTMGVYTYFGGVPELLQAVADEGFKRLATVFERSLTTDHPISDLSTMVLACRAFARSNPHLYDLMFGLSIDGRYSPSRGGSVLAPEQSVAFRVTYTVLVGACSRLVEKGFVPAVDPAMMARQLWSAAHGFIMLELTGYFADVANAPAEILVPMCNNVVIGMGANPEVVASATAAIFSSLQAERTPLPA